MRVLEIVLVMVGFAFLATDASECDDSIINKIKEHWAKTPGGAPKDILLETSASGKTANVRVSPGIGPSDVKCMYTTLEKVEGKPGMDLKYINVLNSGEEKTGTIYVEEHEDHLENKWADGPGKAFRYLIFTKPGVWAYYKCEDQGAKGDPQGYVKATVTAASAAEDSIKEAVDALDKFDIKASKTLGADCPVKEKKD